MKYLISRRLAAGLSHLFLLLLRLHLLSSSIMQSFISLAVLLGAAAPSLAALGKDTLFKNGLGDPLADYYTNIPRRESSRVDIAAPEQCTSRAGDKCSADQIQAVSVKYDDCKWPCVCSGCVGSDRWVY